MGSEESDHDGVSRRRLLAMTGSSGVIAALSGCNETPDGTTDRTTVVTTERTESEQRSETAGEETASEETESEAETAGETETAGVYGVDPTRLDGESSAVEAMYADSNYRRLVESTEGGQRVSHLLAYGHDLPDEPTERPTLHSLSAGVVSTPTAAAGTRTASLVETPLREAVSLRENNLLLAAMGLSGTVEWLQRPLPLAEFGTVETLGTEARVQSFVGALRATAGTGLSPRPEVGYLATLTVSRMRVGGDTVLFGMIDGWDRPPSATPMPDDLDEQTRDLLGEVRRRVGRAALFERSLGRYFRGAAVIPDPDERAPPPTTESRTASYGTQVGLSRQGRIELGYPNATTHTDSVHDSFVVGRNVPSWFSGTPYDSEKHSRGTEYTITADTLATAYPLGDDDTIPFGAIVTPRVVIDGTERNPLASTSLADLATEFTGLWDLVGWTQGASTVGWQSQPTTFSTSVSPTMQGASTTVQGVRGQLTYAQSSGATPTTEPVDIYVARSSLRREILLAVAINTTDGDGYWVRPASAARLFDEAVESVRLNPGTLSTWVDASVSDLQLVQITADTRLERPGGDAHRQPDPPLAVGRNTAPRVDFSTYSGTAFDGFQPRYGVFSFDVSGPSVSTPWSVVDSGALGNVDTSQTDPDRVFHDAVGDGNPDTNLPVFELADSHSAVEASFHAPSGYQYDASTVQSGTDYTTVPERTLRVGFTSVIDPESGTNYGDSSGQPTTYTETVDSAFEYLRRTFPTGVAAYRHDSFIGGNPRENQDYKDARVALERIADPNNGNWTYSGTTMAHGLSESAARSEIRTNGFDVWVLVVPNGYYQFHNNSSRPTGLAPFNDLFAVTTVEGARQGNASAGETAAQEIGHRLGDDQYDDPASGGGEDFPLAQRDSDGSDNFGGTIDYDHARRLDNSPSGTDPPGLVSRAYSLATGEFRVPGGHSYSGGSYTIDGPSAGPSRNGRRITYGPRNVRNRVGRVESYMSYSGWDTWADSIITRIIAESDLNRDARTFRTATVLANLWYESSDAADSGETTFEMRDLEVATDWVYEPDERRLAEADQPVTITLHDPAGTEVARTRATTGAGIDASDVSVTELDHVIQFGIEFPETAAELRAQRGDRTLRVNPITRALEDAVESVSAAGFATDPGAARDRVAELVVRMNDSMAADEYEQALRQLQEYAGGPFREDFVADYEPLGNEFAQARFASLIDRLSRRLERLAEFQG